MKLLTLHIVSIEVIGTRMQDKCIAIELIYFSKKAKERKIRRGTGDLRREGKICMYVCMYVHIYAQIHMYTYIHICMYMHKDKGFCSTNLNLATPVLFGA